MTRTITIAESEAPNLVIPATDELILWNGPAISAKEGLVCILGPGRPGFVAVGSWDGDEASLLGVPLADLRLPLARPEVQAHIVGWLGRGERCKDHDRACEICGELSGSERSCASDVIGGHEWADLPCETCNGSGYIRPPADLYHLLKPQALGGRPDWIRLALIYANVVRVAAGMAALVDVADAWTEGPHDRGVRSRWSLDRSVCHAQAFPRVFRVVGPTSNPYQYHYDWCCETLPYPGHHDRLGGASAADAHLMSKRFALIDDTLDGRAIRFEVPDDTP